MPKQNITVEALNKLEAREEWLMVRLRFFSRMNGPVPAADSPLYKGYLRLTRWQIELEDIRLKIRDTAWDD
jgi:hypothetical protein